MENLQEEAATARDSKQRRLFREEAKEESNNQNREIEVLSKELKTVKDELRATTKKLEETEEELANKLYEVKDLKKKQSNNEFRDQNEVLRA